MHKGVRTYNPQEQIRVWSDRVNDPRGAIRTGWDPLDAVLRRGGFAPSTFIILGGRTHTRKTTVLLNFVVNMLRDRVPCVLVGLDEAKETYVAKLASAMSGIPDDVLEDKWDTDSVAEVREEYRRLTDGKFVLSAGYRPTFDDLTGIVEKIAPLHMEGQKPRVVFIDFLALLDRNKYDGAEVQRITRLMEQTKVWTNEKDIVTVGLHHVGRMDEGTGGRQHGEKPLSLSSLKYGGEEPTDIVMTTFRPALDPLGNMPNFEDAKAYLPGSWKSETKYDAWKDARRRVEKYRNSTFLQVVKNRPGTKLLLSGMELVSHKTSMLMRPKADTLDDNMKLRRDST